MWTVNGSGVSQTDGWPVSIMRDWDQDAGKLGWGDRSGKARASSNG